MKISPPTRDGFSLIEMIAVMAIIAILAAIITPNVLRTIEMAAIEAEVQSVKNLASQFVACTRATSVVPTPLNWTAVLATYADLSATELAQNRRQRPRVLLTESGTNRAMILSVMSRNAALTLPNSGVLAAATFTQIWDTVFNSVSPSLWTGAANWAAWRAIPNSEQLMVIQRINVKAEMQPYPVVLKNNGTATVTYAIVNADGSPSSNGSILVGASANLPLPGTFDPHQGQRIDLKNQSGALNYSYVVSTTGKSIDFDGTNWKPQ